MKKHEIILAFAQLIGIVGVIAFAVSKIRGCWLANHPPAAIVEFAGVPFGSEQGKWNVKTLRGFSKPSIRATPITGKAYEIEISVESDDMDVNCELVMEQVKHVIMMLKEKYPSCSAKFTGTQALRNENGRGPELVYWQMEDNIRHGRKIIIYRMPHIERIDLSTYGSDSGRFQSARIVAIDESLMTLGRLEQNKLDKDAL